MATYDYNRLDDLVDVSELLDDDTRTRNTHSFLLETNYGLTKRLTLTGLVSVIRQERDITSDFGPGEFTAAQGLGDAVLLAKYRLLDENQGAPLEVVVGGGPKIPVGRTNFRNNNDLELPADMQPGTGAWDLMLWNYMSKTGVFNKNLSLNSLITYRLTGKNPDYFEGEYEFGNEFQAGLGLVYRSFVFNFPLDLQLTGRYRQVTEDRFNDARFPNSGGEWVYLIPGVQLNFSPKMAFRASTDLPLYRHLDGTQIATTYKATAAVIFNLSRSEKTPIIPENTPIQ